MVFSSRRVVGDKLHYLRKDGVIDGDVNCGGGGFSLRDLVDEIREDAHDRHCQHHPRHELKQSPVFESSWLILFPLFRWAGGRAGGRARMVRNVALAGGGRWEGCNAGRHL